MTEIKKTITSIFMVPTLKIPNSKESLVGNGFINGYSKDLTGSVEYDNSIYILFKPTNLDKFREFLDGEYERTKSIIDDYDYDDGFVVIVYQLDPKFKADFDLIKQGKYSKTSQAYQKLFPKVVNIVKGGLNREELSLQYRIFNKTQDLVKFWEDQFNVTFGKDQEIWHGFNEQTETLDINKIKETLKENVEQ